MTEVVKKSKFDIVKECLSDIDAPKLLSDIHIKMVMNKNPELNISDIVTYLGSCQTVGANPMMNEAFLVSHYDKRLGHKTGTTIFSYHFLIKKARELYPKQFTSIEADFMHEEVFNPFTKEFDLDAVAVATTYIDGNKVTAKAYWSEYGGNSPMQKKMPRQMLCKCAKAILLRDNFPMMANIYIQEEMEQKFYEQRNDLSESYETIRQDAIAQLPEEEKEIGGELYRHPVGKFRNKLMKDCDAAELEAYLEKLEKRHEKEDGLKEDYNEVKQSIEIYLERINA